MNDIQCLHQVVDILHRSEKLSLIKTFVEGIVDIIPKNATGFDFLSYAHYKSKDYKNAVKYGELALGGSSAEEALAIRYNLGKCYLNANEPVKARNCFDIVSKLQSDKADVKLDLAAAMYSCNQKDDAKNVLLELDKEGWRLDTRDEIAVRFNLGTHYIRQGDFKKGMELLSLGRQLRIWGAYSHKFPIPEWDGSTNTGKHILIIGEGGIGDEIINARFVKHINDRGMQASFASCHNMSSIFGRMAYVKTQDYKKFTTDISDITEYDYWAPAMNLPKILGIDSDELWNGPYLFVDPEYNNKWKTRLTGDLKIGLRWSGNPMYEQDLFRSLSLEKLNEIIPSKYTKYSIQKDNTEDLANFSNIVDLEDELTTFEDALACINNLDVLVTSCTSVAHAAAALGKRVVIMVPIMDYYVWGEGKSTSSWYGDNVTIIRQQTPKTWDSAYLELAKYLENL